MALFTERYTSAANSRLINPRLVRRMKELYNGYRSAAAFGSVDPVFHAGRRAAPEGLQGDRGRGGVGHWFYGRRDSSDGGVRDKRGLLTGTPVPHSGSGNAGGR